MKREKKIMLGGFSFLPIVSFLATFEIILPIVFSLGILLDLTTHVVFNPRLDKRDRIKWIVLLLLLGIVSLPVYWYLHIWKEGSPNKTQTGF